VYCFVCFFVHLLFVFFFSAFASYLWTLHTLKSVCIKFLKVNFGKVLITLFALHCLLPFEKASVAFLIRHTNDLGGMALWHGGYKIVEMLPPAYL